MAALAPFPRNPRTHSDAQISQIANSIREWGWTLPVLIDEADTILAGHGRVLAAKEMGIEAVPCVVARGWSDAQKHAYVLADNKLAENAGWNIELLGFELGDIAKMGDFDIGLTGFAPDEIAALLTPRTTGLTDPEAAPPLPPKPITRAGEVWLLGRHRIICGDATNAEVVARCLNGAKPPIMVTDPPYGVDYDPDWRNRADRANGKAYGARAVGQVSNDDRADWREAWALFPGDVAYVWHGGLHSGIVEESLEATGFEMRAQIIWAKNNIVIGRGDYHWRHEPCWYAVRAKRTGHWSGDRKQSTLWDIDKPMKSETGHGTQKPIECMRRPMANNSKPGEIVYEPFSGSGTTIIAAEMIQRTCYAVEIDPSYVDVAILRWQSFTGKAAVHEETGKSFEEMSVLRRDEAADKVLAG